MAAKDGPIPVRVLAQAARLLREARQLGKYGISVSEPILDYPRLLARTREVVHHVREHAVRREQLEKVGLRFTTIRGCHQRCARRNDDHRRPGKSDWQLH